jgi:TIR domain
MISIGPKRYDAFLSYNSFDGDVVEEIAARLRDKGLKLYLEVWELLPGRQFQPSLAKALVESQTCVTFLGPNGLGPWQDQEIQAAIDRRVRDKDFHVIPVVLPGAERPRRGAVAGLEFLINASWVEFLKTIDDRKAFNLLVAGITGIKPPVPPGDAKRWEGRRPYRGLEAFGLEDAEFFFGRDKETDWLVSGLRREVRSSQGVRFLPVLGPSGSGKSSVVFAGLLPRLRGGAIDGSEGWSVVVMKPGDDPLRNLAAELVARTSPVGAPPDMGRALGLIAQLQAEEQALDLFARLALSGKPTEARLLLVIDQFEEVFTYRPQDDEARRKFEAARSAFFANLIHCASTPGGKVSVVLTMRSDFLGHCAPFPRLNDLLTADLQQVGPMQEHELREAIEQPAFKVGAELESGLTERMLADVKGQAGALPLLQFTLNELWTSRRGRKLTQADYDALGGISGALKNRANIIYSKLSDEDKETCKRVFLRLVQPGEGVEDTKRRVPINDLIPRSDPAQAERVRRVIDRLTDRESRLLTTETEVSSPGAPAAVELAHEALIRGWEELRRWIDDNRAGMRTRDRLGDAAREWAAATPETKHGYLYPGARLADARDWAATHRDDLGDVEASFLSASETAHREEADLQIQLRKDAEARARRERSLRKRFVAVAAAAGVFALVAGGLGWLARDEACRTENALVKANQETKRALTQGRIAESRRLAMLSDSVRPSRLDTAMLLAYEASVADTLEARGCLQRCLDDRPEVSRFIDIPEGRVNSVAFGPGGVIAAGYGVGGVVGGVVLLDAKGARLRPEPVEVKEGYVSSVAFGPGGVIAAGYVGRGGARGGVVLVDGNPASWLTKAAQVANRNLSRAEWSRFFPDTPYRRTIRSCPWPHDLPEAERERAKAWETEHPVRGHT